MPEELSLALDCLAFQALPEAGGLRDQPAKLMRTLRAVLNVYHAFSLYRRDGNKPGQRARWKSENPGLWSVVSGVQALMEGMADGNDK